MRPTFVLPLLLALTACPAGSPPPNGPGPGPGPDPGPGPAPADRRPVISPGDPFYDRVEGTGFANACTTDGDCFKGGCSSEVCSAQPDIVTTCEMPAEGFPSAGASCGCVEGQCLWYEEAGGPAPDRPVQGQPCPDGACADGLSCVTYYGIAGPSGPTFTSCEIPCPVDATSCPADQACITIADGPGRVCRPKESAAAPPPALPAQGEACPEGACAEGLTCLDYYGVAGARGPRFTSCEIPCKGGKGCPGGQTCTMISDGPGQVCR